jgi:hypothetical protein
MHDPFRNAFMIEVEDLLPEVEILDQRRSTRTDFQRVLIVGNRSTLSSRALTGGSKLATRSECLQQPYR